MRFLMLAPLSVEQLKKFKSKKVFVKTERPPPWGFFCISEKDHGNFEDLKIFVLVEPIFYR